MKTEWKEEEDVLAFSLGASNAVVLNIFDSKTQY